MAEAGNDQPLRNSTGKLKATAKGVGNVPNYLRASTGSCHDACKYGTPYEFKAKPWRPVKRRSVPHAEIPVEIFVPSDKRRTKTVHVKPSSSVPDVSVSTKIPERVSGRSSSGSVSASKLIRQPAPSSTKVRSSNVVKQIGQETRMDLKSLSTDSSNSVKQESSLDVKSLSPEFSNAGNKESSLDMNPLNSVKQESSSDVKYSITAKQESSSDVKPSPPDSSISAKQESSLPVNEDSSLDMNPLNSIKQESSSDVKYSITAKQESSSDVKSSPPDSSISAKQESSLAVKSSPVHSSITAKEETLSTVKPPSVQSSRKVSSSQRVNSVNVSKSTVQDVQSRRKSSSSNASGPVKLSASKATRSPHPMSGSIIKTSSVGTKSVKPEVKVSNGKAPLKITSTKPSGSSKSKSNRASTGESSSPNLPGRTSSDVSSSRRVIGSNKIVNDSKKNTMASSTITLTPNLPGTKVANLNVRKSIAQNEGSREAEATSDFKEPENEKIPEKTLHMIEVESNLQSPESVHAESVSIQSIDSLCQSKSQFSSEDAVETNSELEYTESEAGDDLVSCDDNDTVNMSTRKGKMLLNEGDENVPVKLKFRRGKVVDPQSEHNSPRRLRFRRRASSGYDQRANNEHRRSFKARDNVNGDDATKPVEMKVVLRHQDVQEKKTEKGLLNVVIEETASKLVETRKSKVKALVGAFESVISLQESKSSSDKISPHSSPGR